MKKLILLPILFLLGCEPQSEIVTEDGRYFYKRNFNVRKVKVDGFWYYASKTDFDYWVLGPRVPDEVIEKIEK